MPFGSGNRPRWKSHTPYASNQPSSIISTPGSNPLATMALAYASTSRWFWL